MMDKLRSFIDSLKIRVALAMLSMIFFVALLNYAIVQQFVISTQFEQLRDKLKIIAHMAAITIDTEALAAIPLDRDSVNMPQFRIIAEQLQKIKRENISIQNIYIISPTGRDGIWQFIVDPEPISRRREGITSYPGDKYNAERSPEILHALQAPSAEKKLFVDEGGMLLSGYSPIIDKNGKVVAVLGVDVFALDVYLAQKELYFRSFLVLILATILSIIMGIFLAGNIMAPLANLVKGARSISLGDLQCKIPVHGAEEFKACAMSFNQMVDDLRDVRKKNHDYFYGVIQALVRIVEAKDPYTRGHSERVAEYAEKIAKKMGFSVEPIEMLNQAAILHDVGKLAVNDSILNKTGRLTPEEWDQVKTHPVIGEDILKPVSLRPEMLSVVRGHHERYDGKGYPDHQSGAETNLFAQILSVADAYDAMTSSRAYREALSKEAAIVELWKNCGTQFNPQIVEVFVSILNSEDAKKA